MDQTDKPRYWAVIPAAGAGRRMQTNRPKQYLKIAGDYVLSHTLRRLLGHPKISGAMVVISPEDEYWHDWQPDFPGLLGITAGGAERAHSVLNGLHALQDYADDADWVLVHDAARPCLRSADIDTLIEQVTDQNAGGLLALPASDTVKQTDAEGYVVKTQPREQVWLAQTPQMFGLGALIKVLEKALVEGYVVTDEASAIEHAGGHPKLVQGHGDNIKITRPGDEKLAEWFIQRQQTGESV